MRRLRRLLGGCLVVLTLVGGTHPLRADPLCPAASQLLSQSDFAAAVAESRRCLQEEAAGWQVRLVLARALGFLERYDEALLEVAKVRAEVPDNAEVLALSARLLFWKGEIAQAFQALQALPGEGADLESALLAGDVATAHGRPEIAEPWYWAAAAKGAQRSLVLTKLARLRELVGKKEEARDLLGQACALGETESAAACARLQELDTVPPELNWMVGLEPGYMLVTDRPDAWNGLAVVGYRPTQPLFFTLSGDLRTRDYGEGAKRDLFLLASAYYRASTQWGVDGAVGGTVARVFSPTFTAYVEPWYRLAHSLVGSLKLWHLQFGDTPIEVISPHFDWYLGDFMLDVRYYLSIAEAGVGHAGTAKLHWFLDPLRLSVGGGAGDKADYLDSLEANGGNFWFVTAGVAYRLPTHTHLSLEWLYRDETVAEQSYKFHQFLFGIYQWF